MLKKMKLQRDAKNQAYIEVAMSSGFVRVTYLPESWDDSPAVRFQIKDDNTGKLRRGPDIPVSEIGKVQSAIMELILNEYSSDR